MAPRRDDESVPNDVELLRVLWYPSWATTKGGRERPSSVAFKDSNLETSCFVRAEMGAAEVRRCFPGHRIASALASTIRSQGYWIERRPDEDNGNSAHVVIGPPREVRDYDKRATLIATHATSRIIPDTEE
jgi:hypothetical protein